jgi:DNA-binding transcriptional ArsR family regulator
MDLFGEDMASPPAAPTVSASAADEIVLDAVRFFGRGVSAAEIAEKTSLPIGNVGVALKRLRDAGKVAKTGSRRDSRYGLISPGSVAPFKRIRRADSNGTQVPHSTPTEVKSEDHQSEAAASEENEPPSGESVAP